VRVRVRVRVRVCVHAWAFVWVPACVGVCACARAWVPDICIFVLRRKGMRTYVNLSLQCYNI
jgi:hypothetical protein